MFILPLLHAKLSKGLNTASRFTENTNRHCLSVLLHPTMQCTHTESHLAQICTIYPVDLFDWGRITFVCDQAKNGYLWNIFCKSCFALISCASRSSSFCQRKCFNYIYFIVIIRQRSKYFTVGPVWVKPGFKRRGHMGMFVGFIYVQYCACGFDAGLKCVLGGPHRCSYCPFWAHAYISH